MNTNDFVEHLKRSKLYKGEKVVRVVTPMGILMGAFVANASTLPQLVAINKSSEGGLYFRWSGIKHEECV